MTLEEIAARLPGLTGSPHDDATITALAEITAEAIRVLNHATFPRAAGLSDPATVNRVAGQLATAAERLPQLCRQLTAWTRTQYESGRLAHTSDLHGAVATVTAELTDSAALHADLLGDTFTIASRATAGLYRPDQDGEDQ